MRSSGFNENENDTFVPLERKFYFRNFDSQKYFAVPLSSLDLTYPSLGQSLKNSTSSG